MAGLDPAIAASTCPDGGPILRDRGREGVSLPSLRTVRAIFPHTALQSLVSSSGVPRVFKGCVKGEQPLSREEGIRPSPVVSFASSA
jgi:hypothetical protein